MSESLPGTAPSEDAAVPPVGDQAPASDQAVVTESAPADDGEKFVPASRFNGLMGKYQQTENALRAAQQTIAELQANPPAKEESVTDVSGLEQQVAQLQQMLVQERLESARAKAIEEFPGAKDFADLIIADTPEDVRAMAKLLHERVEGRVTTPPATPEAPAAEEGTPPPSTTEAPPATPEVTPPVVAGGTAVSGPEGAPSPQERIAEAIRNKDFPALLQAKHDLAVGQGQLVL